MAGQLEAGAEIIERLQDLQTLFRGDAQGLVLGRGQVGIGAGFRATDTTADLIELSQAEHVGAVDDQGVGGRHVETGFDDGRRQQHIVLAFIEGVHNVFESRGRQLAVADNELDLRHLNAKEISHIRQIAETRHNVIDLASAILFTQ